MILLIPLIAHRRFQTVFEEYYDWVLKHASFPSSLKGVQKQFWVEVG